MNVARDLLVLSIQAHQNGKFADAGTLYAAALASDDAPALLAHLEQEPEALEAEASDTKRTSLAEIAQALSAAMEEEDAKAPEASGEDGDADFDDEESDDTESDDTESDDGESDEEPAADGASESTSATLVPAVTSPIRLKSAA